MKMPALLISLLFSFGVMASDAAKKAFEEVKAGKAVMVDVREADEVKSGMIERAVFFPKSKFDTDSNWKKEFAEVTDKKKVYLYCRSGRRSGMVQAQLKTEKIESVNLGGYDDLKKVLPTTEK